MARNKINITSENAAEWLASCGFIFPTNEKELARYNMLYGEPDPSITGEQVDPFKIIRESADNRQKNIVQDSISLPEEEYKMVARKLGNLPEHIIGRIKKNQENKTGDADDIEKKGNQ